MVYKTCTSSLCSLEVQHMLIIVIVKDLLLPFKATLGPLMSLVLRPPVVPPDLGGKVRLRLPALLLQPLIIHPILESSPLLH